MIADWRRMLIELRSAAEDFNGDGIPVAIGGLSMLAAYIEASSGTENQELVSLARDIASLGHLNESFEVSARGRADFNRWSPNAKSLISRLEEFTASRFPTPGATGPGGV